MLKDEDRIFKNLYNDLGWDIFGAWRNTWISSNSGVLDDSTRPGSLVV